MVNVVKGKRNRQILGGDAFVGGLNTEINDVTDAGAFTSEELNCLINADKTRTRRLGIDFENQYKFSKDIVNPDGVPMAFSMTEWTDISNNKSASYIVVQAGRYLQFFRNSGAPFSAHQEDFRLDLQEFILEDSAITGKKVESFPVTFTKAYGGLFISSPAIHPFFVESLEDLSKKPEFESEPASATLSVQTGGGKRGRAFGGWLEVWISGIQVFKEAMPAPQGVDVGQMRAPSARYWANRFNALPADVRRNFTAVPITPYNWETTYQPWPDYNNNGTGEFAVSPSGDLLAWSPEFLKFEAPLGRLYSGLEIRTVLAYYEPSRDIHFKVNERKAETGGYLLYSTKKGLYPTIRDFKGVEDGLRVGEAIATLPTTLSKEHWYNLLNQGWTGVSNIEGVLQDGTIKKFVEANQGKYPANNMQWFVAKNKDTQEFVPADLLKIGFGDTPAPMGHFKLDYFTQDRTVASTVAGLPIVKPAKNYVQDTASYAGRIFYLTGDTLLYSQIIAEDTTKADLCCQSADPTSEKISDLIETDGGLIKLPQIGEGIKLATLGAGLLVIGTKGSVVVGGGPNNIFSATAYTIGNIQSYSTISPQSFVQTDKGLMYWGDVGIVRMGLGDSIINEVISESTIQTFYNLIPQWARERCVGVFDQSQKQVYWLYPEDIHNPQKLTRALVLNTTTGAWTPYKFSTLEGLTPYVVGAVSLESAYRVEHKYPLYAETATGALEPVSVEGELVLADSPDPKNTFRYSNVLFLCFDQESQRFTFGNLNNLNYKDWAIGDREGAGADYESYLISHPVLLNEPYSFKVMPYLLGSFRRTETGFDINGKPIYPSSCLGSVVWDWNNSGENGKWDADQNLYRYVKGEVLNQDVITTRTRVHGTGRSFQVKLKAKDNSNFVVEKIGFQLVGGKSI